MARTKRLAKQNKINTDFYQLLKAIQEKFSCHRTYGTAIVKPLQQSGKYHFKRYQLQKKQQDTCKINTGRGNSLVNIVKVHPGHKYVSNTFYFLVLVLINLRKL